MQTRDEDGFTVYTVFPVKAPEEKRGAVAAFLTRANYGLILGSFELDFDDGEIRFKVTAICGAGAVPRRDGAELRYGLLYVRPLWRGPSQRSLYGDADPIKMVDAIERGDRDEDGESEAPVIRPPPGGTMLS